MRVRVNIAIGAVFGCVLGLGASVSQPTGSSGWIGTFNSPAGIGPAKMGFPLTFSNAQASGTKRSRRRDRREAAERAAEEQRTKEETEKKFKGVRRATLPTDCVYDLNASTYYSAEIYTCDGLYYQGYKENGVTVYEGHPIGMDREEIQQERARRLEAEKKRKAEAAKKKQAGRRAELPKDCGYDSYASASSGEDIYVCQGVRYRQYREKGTTGYELVQP